MKTVSRGETPCGEENRAAKRSVGTRRAAVRPLTATAGRAARGKADKTALRGALSEGERGSQRPRKPLLGTTERPWKPLRDHRASPAAPRGAAPRRAAAPGAAERFCRGGGTAARGAGRAERLRAAAFAGRRAAPERSSERTGRR